MGEQVLQQILQEIKLIKIDKQEIKSDMHSLKSDINSLKSGIHGLKSQLDENTSIIKVIRDQQAYIENLASDVNQIHGEIKRIDEKLDSYNKDIVGELQNIRNDLDFTYQKTALNEREIYKLKHK